MVAAKQNSDPENNDRIEVHVEEFVPYACHFDKNTILTKNGELLQVIKVTGFNFETVKEDSSHVLTLREALRNAVKNSIKTNDFALWIHTVRRNKDISTDGYYGEDFANELNSAWIDRHDFTHKHINELYISVLIEGQSLSITDIVDFFRNLYFPAEFRYRQRYLESASAKLHEVMESMQSQLQAYGAQRLEVVKREGIYYSEITEFINHLINLEYNPMPLAMVDLSEILPSRKISFGFNALEVSGKNGQHFGAILSVKEYHEISTDFIDEFLQLPEEFIITETFDFVNQKKVLKQFENYEKYLTMSGDKTLAKASGLEDILTCDSGSQTDFGEHQITIMLLEDNLHDIESAMERTAKAFHELGIVVVREDVFLEDCYWAQLPGNFEFIKRLSPIDAKRIGGYASLYNFPAGKLDGNHWGPAVTVFHTVNHTPYFFNFHYEDNGHTLIVGPYGSGKTVLLNFLISEARKYDNKLFFIDHDRTAEIFIRAIRGNYHKLSREPEKTSISFNPLQLEDSSENRTFLSKWLEYLVVTGTDYEEWDLLIKDNSDNIDKAIDYLYSLEKTERSLENILAKFWPFSRQKETQEPTRPVTHGIAENLDERKAESDDESIIDALTDEIDALLSGTPAKKEKVQKEVIEDKSYQVDFGLIPTEERLAQWYGDGKFAHLFNNKNDELSFENNNIFGIDLTHIVQDNIAVIPVIFYLLYRIEQTLDGSSTILVLDEAWSLVDNPAIAPELVNWLDRMRHKNTIVIFATESLEDVEKSSITRQISDKMETKVFLPNPDATEQYKSVFGLNDKEFGLLNAMSSKKREFLLKHNIDAVVAKLNLDGMDYELAVLAAKQDNIDIMEKCIAETGNDPKDWLPLFKARMVK